MHIRNDWHTISAEAAARILRVNPFRGLSARDAKRRKTKHGENDVWFVRRMETSGYLLHVVGDLSTVLLLITAVLAFIFKEQEEAVVMCIILAIGVALRIIAYIKAKRVLEDNAAENIPSATVLRDGTVQLIRSPAVVPGDVVILHPGDTVPCDGRVISRGEAHVSEFGITENRASVRKFDLVIHAGPGSAEIPCESRPNILYAGSTVLRGDLRMLAIATGDETLISRKQGGIEIPSADNLPLLQRLSSRCKISELCMLAFVIVISALSLLPGRELEQVFFSAVALAAASMSEYMTVIGCIIVAITARDRHRSNVHRKGGTVITDCTRLETIARVNRIILGDGAMLKSGKVSFGSFFANGRVQETDDNGAPLAELLQLASEASGTWSDPNALSGGITENLRTDERATIVKQAATMLRERYGLSLSKNNLVIDRQPGTAAMAAGIDSAILQPMPAVTENSAYIVALSDVQRILRCCSTYATLEGERPLTDDIRRIIFTETARLEYIGAKVLAVSKRPSPFLTLTKVASLLNGMCFVGFFSLTEQPAEGALDAVRQMKEAGMQIILLSEHPEHDLYYGHDIGLFDRHTKRISHEELRNGAPLPSANRIIVSLPPYRHTNSPEDLIAASARYDVVRRLGGEQTAFLTGEALDARALGQVGCGIAVSSSDSRVISQALKSKAHVVAYANAAEHHGGLTEGLEAIKKARCAMLNLANAGIYPAVSGLARLLMVLISILIGTPGPSATAILVSGLLFDFGAVLVIAFKRAPKNILCLSVSPLPGLRSQWREILPPGITAGLLTGLLPLLANALTPLFHLHSLRDRETIALLVTAMFLAQAAFLPRMRKGGFATAGYHGIVLLTVLLLFIPSVAAVFGASPMPWYAIPLSLLPALLVLPVRWITERMHTKQHQKA